MIDAELTKQMKKNKARAMCEPFIYKTAMRQNADFATSMAATRSNVAYVARIHGISKMTHPITDSVIADAMLKRPAPVMGTG
jgi:hypothetical protein